MLQPVLVRPVPGGTLRADRRRAPLARRRSSPGFETVPALVRPHDDAESLELALIENMAREDLNPVEEARACALLVEELGLTREDVGRRVGRSRVAVSNLLRLLDLPDEVLDLLVGGRLTRGPRPRAADGARPRRPPPPRPRGRRTRAGPSAQTEARAREAAGRGTRRRRDAPGARREPIPTRSKRPPTARRCARRARSAPSPVAPRGDGYQVTLDFD